MMKLSTLLAIATALVGTQALEPFSRPTVEDAAKYARTLIKRESLANVNTIYQTGDSEGLPTSFVEYYADCGDGNPVILAIDMSTSFKNVNNGSPATLSVRVGDHPLNEHVNPKYPGSRPRSVAGSPRINLRGKFVDVAADEVPALEACFLKRHRDAGWWLPGNPIHKSHWVKFEVGDAYYLGGFGDTGYIGKISSELYHNATSLDDHPRGPPHEKPHHPKRPPPRDEEPPRDFSREAIKAHRSVLRMAEEYTLKILNQVETLKQYLATESKQDYVMSLEHEESESILDIFRAKLEKRNEVCKEVNLKNFSDEQIVQIIEELLKLKTELDEYTAAYVNKIHSEHKNLGYDRLLEYQENHKDDKPHHLEENARVEFMRQAGMDVRHDRKAKDKQHKGENQGVDDYHLRGEHEGRSREHHQPPCHSKDLDAPEGGFFKNVIDLFSFGKPKAPPYKPEIPHGNERRPVRPHGGKRRPEPPHGDERRPEPPHGDERRPVRPHGDERRPEPPHGDERRPEPPHGDERRPEPPHGDERRPEPPHGDERRPVRPHGEPNPDYQEDETHYKGDTHHEDSKEPKHHARPGIYSSSEIFEAHHPGEKIPEELKDELTVVLINQDIQQ